MSDASLEDVVETTESDAEPWRPVLIGWEDHESDQPDEVEEADGSKANETEEAPAASPNDDRPVSEEEEDEEAEFSPGLTRHVEEMAGEPPDSQPVLDDPHILVVDDDPQTRRFVRALLEHHDYRVTEARNGNAALELLKEGIPYSMVLLDLNMPKLGGEEVLSVLKSSADTRDLPVVVLTAANGRHEIEVLEKGADDYVAKPIVPDRLIARIRVALRRGTVERSA
jgi:CheY-like chemotaxis protein